MAAKDMPPVLNGQAASEASSDRGRQTLRRNPRSDAYSASANARMFGPEATATICLQSNSYVIGEAFQSWLVWNCQRTSPSLRVDGGEGAAVLTEEDEPARRRERASPGVGGSDLRKLP